MGPLPGHHSGLWFRGSRETGTPLTVPVMLEPAFASSAVSGSWAPEGYTKELSWPEKHFSFLCASCCLERGKRKQVTQSWEVNAFKEETIISS